jgi:DNA-binding protein YbaB
MAKGIGGMGNLLKQAQEMQSRMAKIQEELAQKMVNLHLRRLRSIQA